MVSTILRWHFVDSGGATIVIGGTMSPILMNAGDRGYKIIKRSNSLRFMIYAMLVIMHYKHRVGYSQLVRTGGTKIFSLTNSLFCTPIMEFVAPPLF